MSYFVRDFFLQVCTHGTAQHTRVLGKAVWCACSTRLVLLVIVCADVWSACECFCFYFFGKRAESVSVARAVGGKLCE